MTIKVKNYLVCVFIAFCTTTFSGCAAFMAHDLPVAPDSLIDRPNSNKIRIFHSWHTYEKSTPSKLENGHEAAFIAGHLRDSILRSNCCEMVQIEQQADVIIHAKIQSYSTLLMVIPAILNSGSLGVIPYWENRRYNVEAVVTNVRNKNTKTYLLQDGVFELRWLPLIITGPFFSPNYSWEFTQKNLTNNLIYRMQKDNLI